MTCSDEVFMESLCGQLPSLHLVGSLLRNMGFSSVAIPPVEARGDISESEFFRDDGDLLMTVKVSVKQRSFNWTSCEDFPYPTLIIDEAHELAASKVRDVYLFASVSADKRYVAIVPKSTMPHWTMRRIFNRRQADWRTVLEVKKERCVFLPLSYRTQASRPTP